MNTVKVRNLEIGTGMPKVSAPVAQKTTSEILENAERGGTGKTRCCGVESRLV